MDLNTQTCFIYESNTLSTSCFPSFSFCYGGKVPNIYNLSFLFKILLSPSPFVSKYEGMILKAFWSLICIYTQVISEHIFRKALQVDALIRPPIIMNADIFPERIKLMASNVEALFACQNAIICLFLSWSLSSV